MVTTSSSKGQCGASPANRANRPSNKNNGGTYGCTYKPGIYPPPPPWGILEPPHGAPDKILGDPMAGPAVVDKIKAPVSPVFTLHHRSGVAIAQHLAWSLGGGSNSPFLSGRWWWI